MVFVLGESFFDVTELPGVEYAEDPITDFPPSLRRGRLRQVLHPHSGLRDGEHRAGATKPA